MAIAGIELSTSGLQFQRADHWALLPPLITGIINYYSHA